MPSTESVCKSMFKLYVLNDCEVKDDWESKVASPWKARTKSASSHEDPSARTLLKYVPVKVWLKSAEAAMTGTALNKILPKTFSFVNPETLKLML